MTSVAETVDYITAASSWDQRVARIRQIPQRHGYDDWPAIHAEVARLLYVPHLGADFAYVHPMDFYESDYFERAYEAAAGLTAAFELVSVDNLADAIRREPRCLLVFRTITGLTRSEFAASTSLVGEATGRRPIAVSKVDSMERSGNSVSEAEALVAADTIDRIMSGSLFGDPPGDLRSKQDKPDTVDGWETVRRWAQRGVPYAMFLHQRHYGGAFRQLLDATSERRGDLIEDAVEALFQANGIPYIRTGSHNQRDIADRFEVTVLPAPDFVVYDSSNRLQGLLECKGANDGGTARDKALRFERLRDESIRLGGVPLIGVLGGLGWTRVNDTLGPVVRDCDGRVFTLATLPEMMQVAPFSSLVT